MQIYMLSRVNFSVFLLFLFLFFLSSSHTQLRKIEEERIDRWSITMHYERMAK